MPIPVNIKNEEYDLYCGRSPNGKIANPTKRGWLGNPVKKNQPCRMCGEVHSEPGSTLECFETYLRNRLQNDKEFRRAFLENIGEHTRLGCFCKPKPCHTDIINKLYIEITQ